MKTPINDFVTEYINSKTVRFHMPGHKGIKFLGCEDRDLTEITMADELYHPDGIIAESEANASKLFGSGQTCFSTEGSSQCIRAMLSLAISESVDRPLVLAARNVHKAFVYSAALLDFDVEWLYPTHSDSLCCCTILPQQLEERLKTEKRHVSAVYITSPDYLGNIADISGLAEVCRCYGTLLLVDNAHGAYLRFLNPSKHPMDLGADMCCDSAHKTLPALTGAAYLHIHGNHVGQWDAKRAMEMFGSTSPSYLILQSLDRVNRYLSNGYEEKLCRKIAEIDMVKNQLTESGWCISASDPLRITLDASGSGWGGKELADFLRAGNMECEYSDPDSVVLMITPETTYDELIALAKWLGANQKRKMDRYNMPVLEAKTALTIRKAMFSAHEIIPVSEACGRICGAPTVSCPPAIPVVISGEFIAEDAVSVLKYYGIDTIEVLK